jgi:hypothetical protein
MYMKKEEVRVARLTAYTRVSCRVGILSRSSFGSPSWDNAWLHNWCDHLNHMITYDSLCSYTGSFFIIIRNQLTSSVLLTSFLCTYPFTRTLSWLVLISFLRALFKVDFVIVLTGLSFLLIYWISMISLRLYNCRSAIISIIRRFSCVIPSLTKHLYNEYKSVQTTIRVCGNPSCLVIILIVVLIAIAILTLSIIL